MKSFFQEHPILATCITSCFMVTLITCSILVLTIVVIGKGITSISNGISTNISETTANDIKYNYLAGNSESKNKFLKIPIKGVILTNKGSDGLYSFLPDQTYGYSIKDLLIKVAEEDSIKGIIFDIDSPGGTIAGAKAISDGVAYYKQKTQKPVLAYISGMGASGAYWSAASTDHIIADTGSLTGSIGVIMGPFKYYNKVLSEGSFAGAVATENGIESYYITAGENKDVGDPYKRMSPEAFVSLQTSINDEYNVFVNYVAERRNLKPEYIKGTIGAMIYGNKQAIQHNLIDSTGNRDNAYNKIANLANIGEGDFQIVTEKTQDFWSDIFKVTLLSQRKTQTPMDNSCNICGDMLFLYGKIEDYRY